MGSHDNSGKKEDSPSPRLQFPTFFFWKYPSDVYLTTYPVPGDAAGTTFISRTHTRRQPESQAKRYLTSVSRFSWNPLSSPSLVYFLDILDVLTSHGNTRQSLHEYGSWQYHSQKKTHAFTITICHLFRRFAKTPCIIARQFVPHSRLGPCWQYSSRTFLLFSIRLTPSRRLL